MALRVFLSYRFSDQDFARNVYVHLDRQDGLAPYFYERRSPQEWPQEIMEQIDTADCFVLFAGSELGNTQLLEAKQWAGRTRQQNQGDSGRLKTLVVGLEGHLPADLPPEFRDIDPTPVESSEDTLIGTKAARCAREISVRLLDKWTPYDGLPTKYVFEYEKGIIAQYASGDGRLSGEEVRHGCPEEWPRVVKRVDADQTHENPLGEEWGRFRGDEDTILVDVRSRYHTFGDADVSGCEEGVQGCCLAKKRLTFPEAGPRKLLRFGNESPLRVGVLVSGGIAPGINAVIAGLVDRHKLYWKAHYDASDTQEPILQIYGYRDGFSGLLRGEYRLIEFRRRDDDKLQDNESLAFVNDRANAGGSMFGTSRCDILSNVEDIDSRNHAIEEVLAKLWHDRIDILYVIGGDGSMKAAHALDTINQHKLAEKAAGARSFNIVGIPKTMDNDILWVWQSFGFLSAVQKAEEFLRQLHTEASSNPRLCVVQLFGSDSGFVVSHTALASSLCDAALIPEIGFTMDKLFSHVRERLTPRFAPAPHSESPFGVIVMAETAVPEEWAKYVDWHYYLRECKLDASMLLEQLDGLPEKQHIEANLQADRNCPDAICVNLEIAEIAAILDFITKNRRVLGQTPDPLRTGGLKLVSRVLQEKIRLEMGEKNDYWKDFRVFTNEPRHLVRAIPPSTNDTIVGQRFGALAVDNAMAGYTDFMISQWLTEYVLVPLSLVVLGRKRVPRDGIFWKSVLAKTGQPESMAE